MSALAMARESKGAGAQAARKSAGNLRINQPDDAFEQEADRVAEEVLAGARRKSAAWSLSRIAMPSVQRQCTCGGECDDCKKNKKDKDHLLQREPSSHVAAPAVAPPSVHEALRGGGRPLDAETRAFMESGFAHDFGRVRIFADERAAASARDVHANAYTVGESIVFNRGRYAPASQSGRRLLAHELAHVVQQNGGGVNRMVQRDDEEPHAEVTQQGTGSVLEKAYAAADRGNLPEAVRLANGLSAYEMKYFLAMYQGSNLIPLMHESAVATAGVGEGSAIAKATEAAYLVYKKKKDFDYQKDLAKQNGLPPPVEGAPPPPPPKPLTVEEKKQKCASGELQGLKTFPIQLKQGMFEFNSAPLTATRTSSGVQVSQPQNSVLGNRAFRRDTKTLPLQVFTGGIKLANDDVVRVRMYDSDGKPLKTICLTGEEMLKVGAASDDATLLAIGSTAVQAASVFLPGASTVAGKVGTAALQIGVNEGFDVAGQASMVKYGLQDKIDWGQIAFDTLFQVITAGVGGRFTEAVADRAAAKAGGEYSRAAIQLAVRTVIPTLTGMLKTVANQAFDSLRGQKKDMTVEEFMKATAIMFADSALQAILHAAKPDSHAAGVHEDAPPPQKSSATAVEQEAPKPTTKKAQVEHHEEPASPSDKPAPKAPAKNAQAHEMEPEGKTPAKAVPKGEALAEDKVDINGEKHEVIGSKKGFGRCSDSPCPAIPIVYREDLDAHAEFAERYKAIRKLGETDVDKATHQAAELVRDIEMTRRNAAKVPRVGSDAPTDPNRNMSREEWKEAESKRRWGNAVDQWGDAMEGKAAAPKVSGGEKSGYYLGHVDEDGNVKRTKVPGEPPAHVDIDADPKGPDVALPKKAGETGRQAAERVRTVIGKKLSDVSSLKTLWDDARASVLSRNTLTKDNYAELYDKTRDAFWARVTGSSAKPKNPRQVQMAAASADAQKLLGDAGFNVGGKRAPTLAGVGGGVGANEVTISLDHLQEKAIGDNWKKALDADNLQMEFALPNSDREIRQARHPELRPAAEGGTP